MTRTSFRGLMARVVHAPAIAARKATKALSGRGSKTERMATAGVAGGLSGDSAWGESSGQPARSSSRSSSQQGRGECSGQPRRSSSHFGRGERSVPIDTITDVPLDLFKNLVQAGETARRRGQHHVVRSGRSYASLRRSGE